MVRSRECSKLATIAKLIVDTRNIKIKSQHSEEKKNVFSMLIDIGLHKFKVKI